MDKRIQVHGAGHLGHDLFHGLAFGDVLGAFGYQFLWLPHKILGQSRLRFKHGGRLIGLLW